jgi:hypothetical protein
VIFFRVGWPLMMKKPYVRGIIPINSRDAIIRSESISIKTRTRKMAITSPRTDGNKPETCQLIHLEKEIFQGSALSISKCPSKIPMIELTIQTQNLGFRSAFGRIVDPTVICILML